MSNNQKQDDRNQFIHRRLQLAQSILEESDLLEGYSGYPDDEERWWLHPRHEREALVVYLLLTCFDKLGQPKRFLKLSEWLDSNKDRYKSERDEVLKTLPNSSTHIEAARALAEKHDSIYGVKNSFFRGIEKLSEENKHTLLSSIDVVFEPEYDAEDTKTIRTSQPLSYYGLEYEEYREKLDFLYRKRNRFTHNLKQCDCLSSPLASGMHPDNKASWVVQIIDNKLSYASGHHEVEVNHRKRGGAYIYSTHQWPFILFHVLYKAIDIPFEITSIRLRFQARFYSSDPSRIALMILNHSQLRNFASFANRYSS